MRVSLDQKYVLEVIATDPMTNPPIRSIDSSIKFTAESDLHCTSDNTWKSPFFDDLREYQLGCKEAARMARKDLWLDRHYELEEEYEFLDRGAKGQTIKRPIRLPKIYTAPAPHPLYPSCTIAIAMIASLGPEPPLPGEPARDFGASDTMTLRQLLSSTFQPYIGCIRRGIAPPDPDPALWNPALGWSQAGRSGNVGVFYMAMGKHNSPSMRTVTAASEIQGNPDTRYRIQVLLHDLSNVGNDAFSEKRLSATTNELYISAPYFTEAEAAQILSTPVEPSILSGESIAPSSNLLTATIQDTIQQRLASFFDKRKASGDARPCGPHDMLPIYLDVFQLQKEDLKNETFLSRLRRSGLGDFMSKCATDSPDARDGPVDAGKKGKKGKKGH
ncbi:MAG: hypothetical protein Q9196_006158 [Gyalolechia fulgens]